jgi:4-hydroxyacetophenone monooxygenase
VVQHRRRDFADPLYGGNRDKVGWKLLGFPDCQVTNTATWSPAVSRIALNPSACSTSRPVKIALEAAHVTVFQRTAQWLFPVPGYRSPFPPQVNWLDRNLPFHTNFMRARTCSLDRIANVAQIDPDFKDPYAVNPLSKQARQGCLAFLERKLGDRPWWRP